MQMAVIAAPNEKALSFYLHLPTLHGSAPPLHWMCEVYLNSKVEASLWLRINRDADRCGAPNVV